MSVDAWTAIFSGLTMVVLIVTAIAAIIQLRHLRANTSLEGLVTLMQDWQAPEFQARLAYVRSELPAKLDDPAFLADFREPGPIDRVLHPEMRLADYYEQVGTLLKYGLIDRSLVLDLASGLIPDIWRILEPAILLMREHSGSALYENFEYFAVLSVRWQRAHPKGCYPSALPRWHELHGHTDVSVQQALPHPAEE
jgi:hypothetical protein